MQSNLTILTLATFIQDLRSDLGIKLSEKSILNTIQISRLCMSIGLEN